MVPMADGDVCSRCGKIRVYHADAGCDRFGEQASLYPSHHPWELEPHYSRHVSAMTTEKLHHKADIAEQLAWRDQLIESLRAELAASKRNGETLSDELVAVGAELAEVRIELERSESLAHGYTDEISQLQHTLAKMRGRTPPLEWISVLERFPEHGVFVAVLYPKQGTLVPAVARLTPLCWSTPQMIVVDARYWAPLPEKGQPDDA